MRTSGVYTSEFWLSLATIVAATVALITGAIDADKWILVVTGAAGAYNLSRGLAKVGPATPTGNVSGGGSYSADTEPDLGP